MSGFVFNEFERKLGMALEVSSLHMYDHMAAFLKTHSILPKCFPAWMRTRD